MRNFFDTAIFIGLILSHCMAYCRNLEQAGVFQAARARNPCRFEVWRGSRNLTIQQWVASLSAMPRRKIRQIAMGEVLSNNPRPVFPIVLMYLAKTEPRDLLAGYYEGILYTMDPAVNWRRLIENWPQSLSLSRLNSKQWTAQRLCAEYEKAGGIY